MGAERGGTQAHFLVMALCTVFEIAATACFPEDLHFFTCTTYFLRVTLTTLVNKKSVQRHHHKLSHCSSRAGYIMNNVYNSMKNWGLRTKLTTSAWPPTLPPS